MISNKNFSRWYVRYIIKNSATFYLFVLIGVILFVYLSLNIKLDVMESVQAEVSGGQVIIDGEYTPLSDTVYLYTDRNEDMRKVTVKDAEFDGETTVLYIDGDISVTGSINADIVVGKQTLLGLVFKRAGRG